jgi:hypothetical protein
MKLEKVLTIRKKIRYALKRLDKVFQAPVVSFALPLYNTCTVYRSPVLSLLQLDVYVDR